MSMSGGDTMAKVLAEMGKKIGKDHVNVGFMEGATYPDGTPVAMVAYWNEFGKGKQPPRPFFRIMIAEKSPTWASTIGNVLVATGYDGNKTLALMGEEVSSDLIESIRNLTEPALSPVTLMLRKLFWTTRSQITGKDVGDAARRVAAGEEGASGTQAKPLEWTGQMVRSVTYVIKSGVK